MPPASSSLLYTWSFESTLFGLGALSFVSQPIETYLVTTQLTLAGLTSVLHIAVAAADLDLHHEISISYLCSMVGLGLLTLYTGLDPVFGPQLWQGSDLGGKML